MRFFVVHGTLLKLYFCLCRIVNDCQCLLRINDYLPDNIPYYEGPFKVAILNWELLFKMQTYTSSNTLYNAYILELII